MHGAFPSDEIDHINHDRVDNRIENLMLFSSHSAHLRYERGGKYSRKEIIFNGVKLFLVLLLNTSIAFANNSQKYTTDDYCNSIFIAEGGYSATYLYGIRSITYKDEAQARQYCKNTVYNTLIKYRKARCKPEWGDLTCLANRYCPINSETDDGTCKFWKGNVSANLTKEQK